MQVPGEKRSKIFHYDPVTNDVDFGTLTVRTGADTVYVDTANGAILHNGVPICGSGGGGPSADPANPLQVDLVYSGINVSGDPDEMGQTITRAIGPFMVDIGDGAATGNSLPLGTYFLTIQLTSQYQYDYVFPAIFLADENGGSFTVTGGAGRNTLQGLSRGNPFVAPTGFGWEFKLDMGGVWRTNSSSTLKLVIVPNASAGFRVE